MQYTTIIAAALGFSAVNAFSTQISSRQTVVGTITSSVDTLISSITPDLLQLNSSLTAVGSNVASLIAPINAALAGTAQALDTAATSILNNEAGTATHLSEDDIAALDADVQALSVVVMAIYDQIRPIVVGGVLGNSKSLVQSEVVVVIAAVAPVVNPVVTFAKAVQCATACSTSQLQADVSTLASDAAAIKAIIV